MRNSYISKCDQEGFDYRQKKKKQIYLDQKLESDW